MLGVPPHPTGRLTCLPCRSAPPTTAQPVDDARLAEILANPGFGQYFTDHMFTVEWTPDAGWHDARIDAVRPAHARPGHGGPALRAGDLRGHEGLPPRRRLDLDLPARGERRADGALQQAPGAARCSTGEDFVAAVDALVEVDQRWVPDAAGEKSLYVRPFMIATETFLGVRPGQHVTFMVIASPAGAYFKGGVKPVTLWLTEEYTRAGRGGMGAAKTGGNYASSLVAQQEATAQGCDQVVFLDAQEGKYVEELGGMNMYFVYDDGRIVTPETGTILEGITRSSIIELAGKLGHQVEERKFSIDEWRDGVASGRITEVFACGTAAVVTPVGTLKWDGGEVARRRRAPARSPCRSARRSSTSSTAAPRTPSAGCTGSSERGPRPTPAPAATRAGSAPCRVARHR